METKVPAPIALFVYNRPNHTALTIEHLKQNDMASESELFIFSDGPKNDNKVDSVVEVRSILSKISGFKNVSIIHRNYNYGLATNIIQGITEIFENYDRVIVLEDDLLTSKKFLKFMNHGLSYFDQNFNIASIHGYVYPIEGLPEYFFLRGADCWGWATWKRAWEKFEIDGSILKKKVITNNLESIANFNGSIDYIGMLDQQIQGKIDSWAVRWYFSAFINDMYTVYPGQSYIQNIGTDGSGTHFTGDHFKNKFFVTLSEKEIHFIDEPVVEDPFVRKKFENFFIHLNHRNHIVKIILYMKRILRYIVNKN